MDNKSLLTLCLYVSFSGTVIVANNKRKGAGLERMTKSLGTNVRI
jgi:hypothetical protein